MSEIELYNLSNINNNQELMLECVKLILNKNKIDHLDEIINDSKKLFNFIISQK